MARHDFVHRVDDGGLRTERERPRDHDLGEVLLGSRKRELAERNNTNETALGIDDEDISDERVRDERAQRGNDVGDRRVGREHGRRRLHQAADRAGAPVLAGEPLLALDLARGERDLAPPLGPEAIEDRDRAAGAELVQELRDRVVRQRRQTRDGTVGVELAQFVGGRQRRRRYTHAVSPQDQPMLTERRARAAAARITRETADSYIESYIAVHCA